MPSASNLELSQHERRAAMADGLLEILQVHGGELNAGGGDVTPQLSEALEARLGEPVPGNAVKNVLALMGLEGVLGFGTAADPKDSVRTIITSVHLAEETSV